MQIVSHDSWDKLFLDFIELNMKIQKYTIQLY